MCFVLEMLKISNKETGIMCEICLSLTIKAAKCVKFQHRQIILFFVLLSLLLDLDMFSLAELFFKSKLNKLS